MSLSSRCEKKRRAEVLEIVIVPFATLREPLLVGEEAGGLARALLSFFGYRKVGEGVRNERVKGSSFLF